MLKPPSFLKKYFWEIDFEKLDVERKDRYVVARLLERGDEEALRWMFKNYPREQVKDVLKKTRALSRVSANYWALVLRIPKSQVLCLQKSFLKNYRSVWPY